MHRAFYKNPNVFANLVVAVPVFRNVLFHGGVCDFVKIVNIFAPKQSTGFVAGMVRITDEKP